MSRLRFEKICLVYEKQKHTSHTSKIRKVIITLLAAKYWSFYLRRQCASSAADRKPSICRWHSDSAERVNSWRSSMSATQAANNTLVSAWLTSSHHKIGSRPVQHKIATIDAANTKFQRRAPQTLKQNSNTIFIKLNLITMSDYNIVLCMLYTDINSAFIRVFLRVQQKILIKLCEYCWCL